MLIGPKSNMLSSIKKTNCAKPSPQPLICNQE